MPKLKGKLKASSDIHILEKFLQTYEKHCTGSQTCVSTTIKQGLKKCIANKSFIAKFVLANVETSLRNLKPVSLTPLLRTIRDERYRLGKELCIWGIQLSPQDVANLAILLELDGRTTYPFSKLEIIHTELNLWSTERLGLALPYSNLSSLVLDYSSNLYINGNNLQCVGATKLLKPITDYAESLGQERRANTLQYSNNSAYQIDAEANKDAGIHSKVVGLNVISKTDISTTSESTGKKKKRKGLKKKSKKPDPGPWLAKLYLADNAIDKRLNQTEKNLMEFIHLLSCLIKNSEHLVEIDINGNAIGEQCAANILEALKDRKKEEMPCLKIKVTPQISSVTFREIFRSCTKLSPTKKKKKKKTK